MGIIDGFDPALWQAAQGVGEVPAPGGTFCMLAGSSCTIWDFPSKHGVGVAEIVHEMAPDAEFVSVPDPPAAPAAAGVPVASPVPSNDPPPPLGMIANPTDSPDPAVYK